MKYAMLLLLVPVLWAGKCGDDKNEAETTKEPGAPKVPACITSMIEKAAKQSPPEGPIEVDEYIYKNKTVYLLGAPCCDQFNTLVDDSCRVLCAPTGGLTGRGDGKCPDFADSAKLVKQLWKKADK